MEIMGVVERPMMSTRFQQLMERSLTSSSPVLKPTISKSSHQSFSSFGQVFNGVSNDAVRLRIFLFSLCDTAKDWLQSLPTGSITTWAVLTQKFLAKYFPPAKTAKMLNDITSFVQLDRESLYDAWERFKSMLRKCPYHELPVWRQVQTFYNGVTLDNRAITDAAVGGTIMKKLPSEAFNIINEIATNLYSYGQERVDKRTAGIHSIDAVSALSAQMTALTHKVDYLGATMWNGAPIGPCGACGQMGHWSQDCNQFSIHEDANFVSHDGRHPIPKSRCTPPKSRSVAVKFGSANGMSSSAKFLKEVLSTKRKWEAGETVKLNEECSDMKEEHEEVPNFVDTGQEVKSKLLKELLLNGSTSNPKVKPPFEVSSDRKKASEDKWGRPNRMKSWRNQVDENVGFYKEYTKAWNVSHMKKKKFKDDDKRHHKNKGPIKVDWQD
ncbi:UNVERIFIED_CONTAM: hypothetical protein Slati_3803200 [Sesamum latifolium]|uniref:CCHC-type domain-containing protein n=1 Tax=Sesamum latifolium TaxID=2727402 RepID=A0AAW2U4K5_9LAMI